MFQDSIPHIKERSVYNSEAAASVGRQLNRQLFFSWSLVPPYSIAGEDPYSGQEKFRSSPNTSNSLISSIAGLILAKGQEVGAPLLPSTSHRERRGLFMAGKIARGTKFWPSIPIASEPPFTRQEICFRRADC